MGKDEDKLRQEWREMSSEEKYATIREMQITTRYGSYPRQAEFSKALDEGRIYGYHGGVVVVMTKSDDPRHGWTFGKKTTEVDHELQTRNR